MISATSFLDAFGRFVDQGNNLSADSWKNNDHWLKAVIGPASAASTGSPLGDCLVEKMGAGLRYRTEEWKIDLVLSTHRNAVRQDIKTDRMELLPGFQPVLYDILIESENSIGISHEEMLKLVCMRARLKVLITYTFDSDGSGPREERASSAIDHARDQFDRVIDESNARYAENQETEYVFVVGRLISANGDSRARIEWTGFLRNVRGKFEPAGSLNSDEKGSHGS